MDEKKTVTGKASVDRPWMKYYPEMVRNLKLPECTLTDYMKMNAPGPDVVAMHYYGVDFTWERIFQWVDETALALRAMGIGEGDQLPVMLRSVPEFIILLLAAEKVGASVLCRDNTIEENAEAIARSRAKVMVIHDFLSQEELDAYCAAGVDRVITLSPYHSADPEQMPEHVTRFVENCYPAKKAEGEQLMSWDEFMAKGKDFKGQVEADPDYNRPLLCVYTSGSTGTSKQVVHSAKTLIGVVHQMAFYGATDDFRPTWLLTILPPCLVAVVVSMMLMPLASNKLLILDPFVEVEDLDLEFMRYRPNLWPHIPMFIAALMRSKRLPADYDMSHLLAAGCGCEGFNNMQIRNAEQFLRSHNCMAPYTLSYGQSEVGSSCALPCPGQPVKDCAVGIPSPLNIISVFKHGTEEELDYGEVGEICVSGPGLMLGYDDEEKSVEALQTHSDGLTWLHTADQGYMDENGIIYMLGRGDKVRYNGGALLELVMENRVAEAGIEGLVDGFFVIVPDKEHEGYYLPYLYTVLEDGCAPEDIREAVDNAMEDFERPVEIIQVPERPFFHFKTNRIGLARQLMGEN